MPAIVRFAAPWSVPKLWEGERAFVLGGGPSLDKAQVKAIRGKGRVFAINDAFMLASWADVLYFADRRWFRWNKDVLPKFRGQYLITRSVLLSSDVIIRSIGDEPPAPHPILRVISSNRENLSRDPTRVAGFDGGSHCLNLAVLFGCTNIILLGFDMRPGNWHNRHKIKAKPDDYVNKFMPSLGKMSIELMRDSVRVVNATPGSALPHFPMVVLADELKR